MRHIGRILGLLLLLLLPMVLWVRLARAQEFHTGNNVTVQQGRTVNSTIWASGRNIDIAGTVNGDVFCAGQSVNISARVNGDIICAGQDVRISGPVNGDVRVAGQSVTVSSKISGSLSAAGQTFSLDQGGTVGRDVSVAANDMNLNGTVGRDLVAGGSTINLASQIGRNVTATVNRLALAPSAKIGGDLTYTSNNNADIAQGATVAGTTHRSVPQNVQHPSIRHIGVIFGLYMLVALLIVAFVLVLLVPRLFVVVTDVMVARPWGTLLVGFLATLIFPMVFFILMATVIGIPLALLLLSAWMLIFELGSLAFSFYIGRLIFRERGNAILIMLVGALIVLIALMVPVLGVLVFLAMTWWGIGMVLTALWRHFQRPNYAMATVSAPTSDFTEDEPAEAATTTRSTTRRKKS